MAKQSVMVGLETNQELQPSRNKGQWMEKGEPGRRAIATTTIITSPTTLPTTPPSSSASVDGEKVTQKSHWTRWDPHSVAFLMRSLISLDHRQIPPDLIPDAIVRFHVEQGRWVGILQVAAQVCLSQDNRLTRKVMSNSSATLAYYASGRQLAHWSTGQTLTNIGDTSRTMRSSGKRFASQICRSGFEILDRPPNYYRPIIF